MLGTGLLLRHRVDGRGTAAAGQIAEAGCEIATAVRCPVCMTRGRLGIELAGLSQTGCDTGTEHERA